MKKVSIIVIIKDTKKYLVKCIDSIINQTFESFELIVVDDHSSVKSDDIIDLYKTRFPSIQYIYLNQSLGPGGARNYGKKIAKGKYIMFIDSDDWIDIICLQKAIPILDLHCADIGMYSLVRNYDVPISEYHYKCRYDSIEILNGITAFKMMSGQYEFGLTISPSPVNKIYRKKYLDENNISFLESVYYEDISFAVQTLLADGKIVTIPEVKYHHYKRAGSIVQSLSKRHFDDLQYVFTTLKNYLQQAGLYQEYVYNYYKIFERFYNLLIRQVFELSKSENEKKEWMVYSFRILKEIINIDEYIKYFNAEEIRRHLQPYVEDTTLR